MNRFALVTALSLSFAVVFAAPSAQAQDNLLNVSYDVMRDFYRELNPAFVAHWKGRTGQTVELRQSHGGSSKQARAVADGLEADVITMNQPIDIHVLEDRGLVPATWADRLPNGSIPFTSLSVFVVRKGNPKNIRDWGDLLNDGVQVVIPHPKITGNGRYTYLSAWAYAQQTFGGDDAKTREFVAALLKRTPVFDPGGRAATTTFMQRRIGDVLITFENEAELIAKEFGRGGFEVVYPSVSVMAEPPVTVVDAVVDRRDSRALATAYLEFLWSDEGQTIAANNFLRPQNPAIFTQYQDRFPAVDLITVDSAFGSWRNAMQTHFVDGGTFDQIYQPR